MRRLKRDFGDAVLIAGAAIIAGGVMGTGAIFLFCVVMLGEPALFVLAFAPLMAFHGGLLGLVSLVYLLPLLWGTRLGRSLPLVMGVSIPLGIGLGTLHPLLGAAVALGAQISTAAIAHCRWRVWVIPRGTRCQHCGYDCRGLLRNVCPECGCGAPDLALLHPFRCQVCLKGEMDEHGRCDRCGAIDFDQAAARSAL